MANGNAQPNSLLALAGGRAAGTMRVSWYQTIAAGIVLIAAVHFVLFGYFLFRTAITSPISDMFTYIADYLTRFRVPAGGLAVPMPAIIGSGTRPG